VLFKLPNFDRVFTLQEQKIPYPGAILGLSNLRVYVCSEYFDGAQLYISKNKVSLFIYLFIYHHVY
jgi:hypothetical protein